MNKKIIAKIALFLALIFVLTSCAGDAPTLLPFINEASGEKDFGGMVFRVLSHADPGEGLDYIADGESPSLRKETFIKRAAQIEKDYNCDIEFNGDTDSNYPTYYISGIPRADIFQCRFKHAYGMYQQNYFIPLNDVPYVDISSGKYGTEPFIDAFTWNGDIIGLWPVHWGYIHMGFSDGMFFNPDIFTEIGQATPNERYEQGTWDWNALQEISDACQSISTGDDPKYLTALNSYFPRMLIRSNGGQFVRVDENGKYSYGLNSPEVIEAMEFANDLLNDGAINPDGSNHDVVTEDFGKGKYVLMCEYNGYYDEYIMDMNDGLGVCYAPIGPKAEEYVTTGLMSIESTIWYITREKSEDLDSLGQFMEIFFEPIDGDTEAWKEEYINYNFLDRTSGEVFLSQMLNKDFDRVVFAYTDSTLFDIIETGTKQGTITESVQKYEQAVNAKLNESINTWND